MFTDCRARRVRTRGCDCDYCRDNAILADGEGVSVSIRFSDSGAPEADLWPRSIFDAAGVPMKADDALHAERGVAEEREKARELAAEQRQQNRTANRQANQAGDEWDGALAKLNSGSIRSARLDRV